jgi:hypothetical protein
LNLAIFAIMGAEKQRAASISGASYATTFLTAPSIENPLEVDVSVNLCKPG